MKLRLKGSPQNTLRLRLLRPEMERLATGDALEETMNFGPGAANTFTYTLSSNVSAETIHVRRHASGLNIIVPQERVLLWAREDQIGIYETIGFSDGRTLELVLEKDFACINGSESENVGTFQNPSAAEAC
jgi:hypothetical protein